MEKIHWAVQGPKVIALMQEQNLLASQACVKLKLSPNKFYSWRHNAMRTKAKVALVGKKKTFTKSVKLTKIPVAAEQSGIMFLTWGNPTQIREFLSTHENYKAI